MGRALLSKADSAAEAPKKAKGKGRKERLAANSTDLDAEFQAAAERHLFLQVLRHTDNNLTQAAQILGISRTTLLTKLTALGLTIERSSSLEKKAGP